jgi:hypothetical protein
MRWLHHVLLVYLLPGMLVIESTTGVAPEVRKHVLVVQGSDQKNELPPP